jgi:uncharacterized protein (DUF2147 family)
MKRCKIITLVLSLFLMANAWNTASLVADDVLGTYWNAEKTAHIRMYKAKNGLYYGKIEYLLEPNDAQGTPKADPENPDDKLKDRASLGMVIAKAFKWDEKEQEWNNGTIYNPIDGKTYDSYIYFENDNKDKLKLRGFVLGMTWLGKTSEWTRLE